MCHLLIAQFDHRLLYIGLRCGQLVSHGRPVAAFCQLRETGAMTCDPIGNAQALRLSQQDASEVLDLVFLFARDEKKTIRDKPPENESHLFPTPASRLRIVATKLIEGKRLEFVQLLKNTRDRRRRESIYTEFFALVILVRNGWFLGRKTGGIPGCNRAKNQRNESNQGECLTRS